MKNILKINFAIAIIATLFSCAKEVAPIQDNDIPQGYVKVYFDAGVVDTKAVIGSSSDGRTYVHWTDDDDHAVNIWYKDANNVPAKVAATIESYSGSSARISALIPKDANMNEFYAEVNGVSDLSGKAPFGSGNNAARVKVAAEQKAVLNSFDPAVAAMGARWVKSDSKPNPTFAFNHLTNLLKISVKNETGKTLNRIVLNNEVMIACNNYWSFEDETGYLKISGSADYSSQIDLIGTDIQDGDYYFVISKANKTSMVLKNMTVTFHFTDGSYRVFSNPAELDMREYSRCAYIGSFTIRTEDLENDIDESTFAPFGTSWDINVVKKAVKGDDGKYVATANNGGVAYFTCNEVNKYGNNIKGKFTFEFYTKDSGTGVLTFNTRGGADTHTCSVYVNDNKVGNDITYPNNSDTVNVVRELTVSKGDKISIVYNDTSGNAYLFFWVNNASHPVTWTEKSAE